MSRSAANKLRILAAALAFTAASAGCADRDGPARLFADDGGVIGPADAGGGTGPSSRRDGGVFRVDAGVGDAGPPLLPPDIVVVEARAMTPVRGPAAGGTLVTITGTGFIAGTTATVGGAPLLDLVIAGERTITGKTPPGVSGVAPVLVDNNAGRSEVAGGFSYVDDVSIDSVTPSRGPIAGGTLIHVVGRGFVPGTTVLVGPRPAFDVRVVSESHLTAVTPGAAAAGAVTVSAVNRNGAASLAGAFVYAGAPMSFTLRPSAGPLAGGNTVELVFPTEVAALGEARVYFGQREAPSVVVRSPTLLAVIAPAGMREGAVDVSVVTRDGTLRSPSGYGYFGVGSALLVQAVVPARGDTTGGTEVRVVGTGFGGGVSTVSFAGALSPSIAVESSNVLRVTTPAGLPGPADVTVTSSQSGAATLAGAFTYDTRLVITAVAPMEGPVAGGTLVEIFGEGFAPPVEVFFGPIPAASVDVVSAGTLRVRSPSGAAGPVDITVRRGETSAVRAAAFTYFDETRLVALTPPRGGIAGGTFVTLRGSGFSASSRAFFAGVPAVEVRYVDAATLTARTPPGPIGRATVAVLGERGAAVLPRAFEYFDPTVPEGGTAGPQITGAVNVTVFDGGSGERLAGAFATLATTGATLYQGLTNRQGQVTFSGPGLGGRQVVTVAKEGYTAITVVLFDAENVTVSISPLSVAFGFGPGAELAVVRGIIKDAFKAIPPAPAGFRRVVIVTSTMADRFTPNPSAPGVVQVIRDDGMRADRTFEVRCRPGDLAVYGLAGHLSLDGKTFIPFQFGMKRYLTLRPGQILEEVQIELGTALSATLEAPLLNAPALRADYGPNQYRMRVFLELGSEGVVTFLQTPSSTTVPHLRQEHLVPLLAVPGAKYTVVAGAYTVEGDQEYSPLVVTTREDITDLSQPVPIGPMMSLATPVSPADVDFLEEDRFVWALAAPPEPAFTLVLVLLPVGESLTTIWQMIVPGALREVQFPDLRALAGLLGLPPQEVLYWAVLPVAAEGFSIDSFGNGALNQAFWKNYSIAPFIFITR